MSFSKGEGKIHFLVGSELMYQNQSIGETSQSKRSGIMRKNQLCFVHDYLNFHS